MSSIVSKLADEIRLHGSYEAYCAFRDKNQVAIETVIKVQRLQDPIKVLKRPTSDRSK